MAAVARSSILEKSGGSIHDEIVPYLDHKLSKNKWKSKKVAKECRNRQSRGNRSNRHHRRKRYYHQSQIARKGIISSSDCKNLKHRRRTTNDSFINESVMNDIYNENQSDLEETLNYYDDTQTFIDPKLLVLASPKRRRRKKIKNKKCKQNSVALSLTLEDISSSMSLSPFTGSEDSNSSEVDLGYYYVPNNYTQKDNNVNNNNNSNDSDSDSSDDSDNWSPWPSNLPDPNNVPLVPAPPKPSSTQTAPIHHPAPVKKAKVQKIVPKEDKDEFPDFKIEDELKSLGLDVSQEREKKGDDNETDKDKDKDKEKEGKEAEMKEINVLEEEYRNEIGKISELNEYAAIEGLASRSSFKEYNKNDETTQMDPKTLKKVFKEIKIELPKNIVIQWNGSMFIRFDEENPRFLQALLTGLDDTPYENGLFLFDIYLHKDYPNSPLKIKHVTKGGNLVYGSHTPGGFSPNLHRDSGKVCLSLLGTWGTNQWDPKTSNIYQVLSSILFWILGAKWAYYMEPNYGGWELTAPMSENDPSKHKKDVIAYNYEIIEKCMKYAILETLKTPYSGFDQVTKVHFKVKKNIILKTILTKWIKGAPSIKVRNKLIPLYKNIKEELNKL